MPKPSAETRQALDELDALLGVGGLKIVTNEHACGAGPHETLPGFDAAACAAYEHPTTNPRHFVWQDVVRLDAYPPQDGVYVATANDGSFVIGSAGDLLKRLREWRT